MGQDGREGASRPDVDKVRAAANGVSFDSPQGTITLDGETQHIFQKAMIGKAGTDGQFEVVWDCGADNAQARPVSEDVRWGASVAAG